MTKLINSLADSVFECVVHPDGSAVIASIQKCSLGERITIELNANDSNKMKSFSLDSSPLKVSGGIYSHVRVLNVNVDGANTYLELEEIPVQPTPYPQQFVHKLIVLEKNANEQWAIGMDVANATWAFFKKTNVFGDYWVATQLNHSRALQERVQEKLRKGYRAIGDGAKNYFDSAKREVIIVN